MKIVYLEWIDAHGDNNTWKPEDEAAEFASTSQVLVKQVGFLMKEDKQYLTLCSRFTCAEDVIGQYGGLTKVPKGMIVARQEGNDRRRRKLSKTKKDSMKGGKR